MALTRPLLRTTGAIWVFDTTPMIVLGHVIVRSRPGTLTKTGELAGFLGMRLDQSRWEMRRSPNMRPARWAIFPAKRNTYRVAEVGGRVRWTSRSAGQTERLLLAVANLAAHAPLLAADLASSLASTSRPHEQLLTVTGDSMIDPIGMVTFACSTNWMYRNPAHGRQVACGKEKTAMTANCP